MAAAAKPKVGDLIKVADPGEVVRPDGVAVTVTGGLYLLTQAGTYVVDGTEKEVR